MIREQKCDGMKMRRSTSRRFGVESLETRQVLSSVTTIMAMDPKASHMIGQVATGRVMVHRRPDDARRDGSAACRQDHRDRPLKRFRTFPVQSGRAQRDLPVNIKARNRSGRVSTASMPMTQGDAVVAWIDTMIEVIKADIANVGMASRTMAMVSAAVYDAVNDIERHGLGLPGRRPGSEGRVGFGRGVRGGLRRALCARPPYGSRCSMSGWLNHWRPSMERKPRRRECRSAARSPRACSPGDANDGSSAIVPYVPGTAPGDWRPTPPTYQVAWGPEWGQVSTFAITEPASDFVAPPPPALNSPQYAAALNQVESLGALNSTTRTAGPDPGRDLLVVRHACDGHARDPLRTDRRDNRAPAAQFPDPECPDVWTGQSRDGRRRHRSLGHQVHLQPVAADHRDPACRHRRQSRHGRRPQLGAARLTERSRVSRVSRRRSQATSPGTRPSVRPSSRPSPTSTAPTKFTSRSLRTSCPASPGRTPASARPRTRMPSAGSISASTSGSTRPPA